MSDTATEQKTAASPAIRTKGILHFTISVRDHRTAADFYSELLGCEIERVSDHFAFMKTGNSYFVLAKMENHANPNPPRGTRFHHAFIVAPEDFDRAEATIRARGIELLTPGTQNHRSFPGRHIYFHDADGNGIEIADC